MPKDTLYKVVHQYNKDPISKEDMRKLQEVGADYAKVKNYVYQRYGGIHSLSKIYPGYTVQNEMAESGLREQLKMPSVYFYLAIFDALRDIKIQWSKTKMKVLRRVNANGDMSKEEKRFLYYVLRVNNVFEAILNGAAPKLPEDMKRKYDALSSCVGVKKLENYLRRQVRKYPLKLHTNTEDRFSMTERAYRYGEHGIYISVKEKRKRIFIPLTDNNRYSRQLSVRLYPEAGDMVISLPIKVSAKRHNSYTKHVGASMGAHTMLTTDEGHTYGEGLGKYQAELSGWLRGQADQYCQNHHANPGRKKYEGRKHKKEEQLYSYMNQELNRFLRTEKPKAIYIPRYPAMGAAGAVKGINYHAAGWQKGYVRKRLTQKCQEHSIELVEVFAKGISSQCSQCGASGQTRGLQFFCPSCGNQMDKKENAARNAKKRGERLQRQ